MNRAVWASPDGVEAMILACCSSGHLMPRSV